ncbi:MAG TPA: PadR family transcriptional regulator [Gemmatimonadales bacterium]|jgi:transcriptional regulator
MSGDQSKDWLHGTLDVLVLKALSGGPRHGYAVARWLEDTTGDRLQIEDGSLYPALYRMERKKWVEASWGMSELGRKAKLYRLTPRGRKQLQLETSDWNDYVSIVSLVLLTATGAGPDR